MAGTAQVRVQSSPDLDFSLQPFRIKKKCAQPNTTQTQIEGEAFLFFDLSGTLTSKQLNGTGKIAVNVNLTLDVLCRDVDTGALRTD